MLSSCAINPAADGHMVRLISFNICVTDMTLSTDSKIEKRDGEKGEKGFHDNYTSLTNYTV